MNERNHPAAEPRRLTITVAANAILVLAILLRNIRPLPDDLVSWLYLFAVAFGYYGLAMLLVAGLLRLVLSPFRRLAMVVPGIIVTVVVYYLLIDSYVYAIVGMHIDLFWLKWIVDDFGAFGLSPATLRSAALALLALIAVEGGIVFLAGRIRLRRPAAIVLWAALPLLYVGGQAVHAVAYETNDTRITRLTPRLPFYAPITSHRRAERIAGLFRLDAHDAPPRNDAGYESLRYPLHPIIREAAASPPPSIVVLFLESWRYDALNDRVTPNIAALARKSTVCGNHYCTGNSTVAGVFGFFYGLYPTYWPAVKAGNAVIHNPVLMDVLADDGYAFGVFARSNFDRHKIKDAIFRDIPVHEDFAGDSKVDQDADMNRQVIAFLRERKRVGKPFLTFAFYKANHAPYAYPPADTVFSPAVDENLMHADDDTDPTAYFNDYRNATHYVDRLVGDVLRNLDSLGLMDNTIVIVTTDHGEEFNDNRDGRWGHGSNYTRYQTQVPLVLYAPGRPARWVTEATSHVDVAPTLLEGFLGCRNPVSDYSNGRNLFTDGGEARPLAVGSYVNHAFIVEDNVYEIDPYTIKEYRLDDETKKAEALSREMLTAIADESGRFFGGHPAR